MAGSSKRERQLAREHYMRQQQRRAQAQAKRRRAQQVIAVVVAVVAIVGGVAFLATSLGGDDGTDAATRPSTSASGSASTSPSASSSASNAASGCTYTKGTEAASRKVSLPTYDASKAATYKKPFDVTLTTNVGDITIRMAADKAPCTVNSFKHLAQSKYFDKTSCHRLTTSGIFVLQCGDPTGSGSGGPGYQFGLENPPSDGTYPAGTLAMARTAEPGSNGSQFFIVYQKSSLPDPGYSIFGQVTEGLDIVTKVAKAGTDDANGSGDGKPKTPVTIESVTIGKA